MTFMKLLYTNRLDGLIRIYIRFILTTSHTPKTATWSTPLTLSLMLPQSIFSEILGNPHSTKTKLKDLALQKNQKFLFIFDFGDDHHFSVRVVGFGNVQKGMKYPLVLEAKGQAPEQYPETAEETDS